MKGKVVNLCIGSMNILFGILLLIFTMYIPKELVEYTVQELTVTNTMTKIIFILMLLVFGIDVFQYCHNRDNSRLKTGYLFGFFALSFFFIQKPAIAIFPILSGLMVIVETLKDTAVEIDSTTAISLIALIMLSIVLTMGGVLFYKTIAQSIKNKENKGNQEYTSDYFKYVTELEIPDIYINAKKDGKYGYINQNGDVVIDFIYDYASPFVSITMYNKDFQIALVCEQGTSKIILKNQRVVMSYRLKWRKIIMLPKKKN